MWRGDEKSAKKRFEIRSGVWACVSWIPFPPVVIVLLKFDANSSAFSFVVRKLDWMMNDKFEIRSRMSQRTIVSKFEKLNGVYASKNQTATIDCTKFSDGESQCKQLSSTKTTQRMVANLNSKKLFCDVVAVDSSSIVAQIIGKKG